MFLWQHNSALADIGKGVKYSLTAGGLSGISITVESLQTDWSPKTQGTGEKRAGMCAYFLNGLKVCNRHCAQNCCIHTIHVWKGMRKKEMVLPFEWIHVKKLKLWNWEEKTVEKAIYSALSPKRYWWWHSKNTSINFKVLVLGSQRSQVTEQLQKPQIKERLVPLIHGILIRNKFWRSVWINTNGLTHCSQQQNKGESFV